MGSTTDDIRSRSYALQMERQQEADIKDKEERHRDQIEHLMNSEQSQQTQIRKDYDVRISEEAESLEQKLTSLRDRNTAIVNKEQGNGENHVKNVQTSYQKKIEQIKHNGDDQIAKLQQYYKKASEDLNREYERTASKSEERTSVRNSTKGHA